MSRFSRRAGTRGLAGLRWSISPVVSISEAGQTVAIAASQRCRPRAFRSSTAGRSGSGRVRQETPWSRPGEIQLAHCSAAGAEAGRRGRAEGHIMARPCRGRFRLLSTRHNLRKRWCQHGSHRGSRSSRAAQDFTVADVAVADLKMACRLTACMRPGLPPRECSYSRWSAFASCSRAIVARISTFGSRVRSLPRRHFQRRCRAPRCLAARDARDRAPSAGRYRCTGRDAGNGQRPLKEQPIRAVYRRLPGTSNARPPNGSGMPKLYEPTAPVRS